MLEPTVTKNKEIMKKDMIYLQHFSQHFYNKS